MDFEEFEKKILEKGYGIVAMNHYFLNNKRHLFCAILNAKKQRAFKEEGENSEDVFENIYNQIKNFEKDNN